MESKVNRAVSLLHAPQEWLAASNLLQLLTRFLGASLLLALFFPTDLTFPSMLMLLGHPAPGGGGRVLAGMGGGSGCHPPP